jgi:hypothetical protein
MSDVRVTRARELHRLAGAAVAQAGEYRSQRDRLVRQLRAEDRRRWTHAALARELGCSPELVALIDRGTEDPIEGDHPT